MKLIYTEEELPQRSEEWKVLRENVIGASEVAVITGDLLKYDTPEKLFKRKTLKLRKKENQAMKRGALMEDESKEKLIEHLKTVENIENPKLDMYFAKHPDYDFIGVSFDGVDLENKFIAELKSPAYSWNFISVFENGIPDYYYPQVQLQLHVAKALWDIEKAYFASYYPKGAYILDRVNFVEHLKHLAVLDIDYDLVYCNAMTKLVKVFWDLVIEETWDSPRYETALKEFRKETEC